MAGIGRRESGQGLWGFTMRRPGGSGLGTLTMAWSLRVGAIRLPE